MKWSLLLKLVVGSACGTVLAISVVVVAVYNVVKNFQSEPLD
jgi:hypothetical protein